MKKAVKIWLITAALLVVVGIGMMIGALAAVDFDLKKLGTIEFETNTYQIKDKFEKISIEDDLTDIEFVLSDNKKCSVECYAPENMEYAASVKDGTLTVKAVDNRSWTQRFGISFESPKVTVSLPEKEYKALNVKSDTGSVSIPDSFTFGSIDVENGTGSVKCAAAVKGALNISTSTGNIKANDLTADEINLKVSTGNIKLDNVTVKKDLVATASTGNIKLTDVTAKGDFDLKASTGNIKFDGCDADTITATTSTGNITGSLLTDKIFRASSHSGKVSVPDTASGGICDLQTNTGNINISIK